MPIKRIILLSAISIVTMSAVYMAGEWALFGRFIEKTDNAYVKADTVVISAKAPGRIGEVLVADNSIVHEGDPLVRIENNDYAARVRQAAAEEAARSAAIETIRKQMTLAEANVANAEASLKSVEAELGLTRTDYNRTAELAKSEFASRQALDKSTTALKAGNAKLESAQANLEATKAEAAVLAAQEEQARGALAAAQASLELAKIDEANTVIRAPKSGVVGNVTVRAGEYASTGRQMMALVPIEDVYVVANFKETQLQRIRAGERVRIEIDAYPGADVFGVVDSLSPSSGAEFSLLPPENATGNFTKIVQRVPVKIRVTDAPVGTALIPGLSVTAAVNTRGADLTAASLFAPRNSDGDVAFASRQ
ncbi:MAG TPA: HlyD family secretion protein [Amphiplicatus sp.]|nr:HlyD family secretion protein [Amphiplicatus sp.]HRX38191.1 HlyD family secretion protein [Parvularculaceae bacterium]